MKGTEKTPGLEDGVYSAIDGLDGRPSHFIVRGDEMAVQFDLFSARYKEIPYCYQELVLGRFTDIKKIEDSELPD